MHCSEVPVLPQHGENLCQHFRRTFILNLAKQTFELWMVIDVTAFNCELLVDEISAEQRCVLERRLPNSGGGAR